MTSTDDVDLMRVDEQEHTRVFMGIDPDSDVYDETYIVSNTAMRTEPTEFGELKWAEIGFALELICKSGQGSPTVFDSPDIPQSVAVAGQEFIAAQIGLFNHFLERCGEWPHGNRTVREHVARVMDIEPATVSNYWRFVRDYADEMGQDPSSVKAAYCANQSVA